MDGSIDMCTSFKQYLLSVSFVPDFSKQTYLIQRMKEARRAKKMLRTQAASRKRR